MSWSLNDPTPSSHFLLLRGCYGDSETIVPSFRAWSLGQANSQLSYYDGLIQLVYSNGSEYNDDRHTARSTLISFLCDPDAGAGQPEFQVKKFKFLKTAFGFGSSSPVIDFYL